MPVLKATWGANGGSNPLRQPAAPARKHQLCHLPRVIWTLVGACVVSCRVGTSLADPSLRTPSCISCKLGAGCQYVDASFSPNGRYFVLGCLGPDVPTYRLMEANSSLGDQFAVRLFDCHFDHVTQRPKRNRGLGNYYPHVKIFMSFTRS